MNKAVLLILTGTLALLTEGCSVFSNFADSQKELEENAVKPVSVQVNTSKRAELQETETELGNLEEEAEPVQEIAGLIPATNPDVRVRSIVRGRNDPFSLVTLNPRIEIKQEKEANARNSDFPENDSQENINGESDLDSPELIFEPTLAQDVVISGLYEANGRIKLIVQAPDENTSRYVEVGQYLSNGQVLVKSIDQDHFPSPLIILEQSGIEVAKTIGETFADNDDDDEDISSLPTISPDSNWLSSVSLNSN